jgi:hypothetical protein
LFSAAIWIRLPQVSSGRELERILGRLNALVAEDAGGGCAV